MFDSLFFCIKIAIWGEFSFNMESFETFQVINLTCFQKAPKRLNVKYFVFHVKGDKLHQNVLKENG